MADALRVGIYGGTFDPIHKGHLHLIRQLLEAGAVDEIMVIPAGEPWMRQRSPMASGEDRLAMAKIAIAELPAQIRAKVSVSDLEINRTGSSYTIDTVEELQKVRPGLDWSLIIGSDVRAGLEKWHRSEELQTLVEVLTIARDGEGLNIDALPVSATQIRASIQANRKEEADLPEPIWTYIKERNLYAS